eukprot:SAG31_NODE_163_length_21856_cov_7.550214_3_plen_83_part_00
MSSQDGDGTDMDLSDDRTFLGWLESDAESITARVSSQRKVYLVSQIVKHGTEELGALADAFGQLLRTNQGEELKKLLVEVLP